MYEERGFSIVYVLKNDIKIAKSINSRPRFLCLPVN